MSDSLNVFGGGARHTQHYRHFNHPPEVKPWARRGLVPPPGVVAIVKHYMGEDFPIESVEGDIIAALSQFAHLPPAEGAAEYIRAGGRAARVVLAAIRRNFKRHPERWAALAGG